MFRGGACRLVPFACDLEGELLGSSQNPCLGKRPPVASGKASERTASPKLGASASPRVVFTNAGSWARHRILTWRTRGVWLRNTKLVKILTSKVKHLFLGLLEETKRTF